jgi:hypothetical protein
MSCKTTSLLAAYLEETRDTKGILALLKEKWPNSASSYISLIKKDWITLGKTGPHYRSDLNAVVAFANSKLRTNRQNPDLFSKYSNAIVKLREFDSSALESKNYVLSTLKTKSFTGASDVDSELSKVRIFPEYISELKLTKQERDAARTRSDAALEQKSRRASSVDALRLITHCREIIANSRSNPFELATALSLLTGRRMIEIFKTGEFERIKGEDRACTFSGQAKKREGSSYAIPLLDNYDSILKGITRLRIVKCTDGLTNPEVNLRYSSSCNTASRKVLGGNFKFHDARMFYGVLTYHTCMPHTFSLNYWIYKTLGHSHLNTSINYSAVQITNVDESLKQVFNHIK